MFSDRIYCGWLVVVCFDLRLVMSIRGLVWGYLPFWLCNHSSSLQTSPSPPTSPSPYKADKKSFELDEKDI